MRRGLIGAWVLALMAPGVALADGALPDSMALFMPRDRPDQVILTTNFGLLISNDAGGTWRWVCEQAILLNSFFYNLGPGPGYALFAMSPVEMARSDDACTWTNVTTTGLTERFFKDVFADPHDARHVLAIVRTGTTGDALIESTDGGRTFGAPRLTTRPPGAFTGVEIAPRAPYPTYVTAVAPDPPRRPIVLRSDRGLTDFQSFEVPAEVTMDTPELRILAVDPDDPMKVYFRGVGTDADTFVLTTNGGQTVTRTLRNEDGLAAFVRRANGHIYLGNLLTMGGWVSRNGGVTFERWDTTLHLRGLAERNGVLWASASTWADGFVVGTSTDDGRTWTPRFDFDRIGGYLEGCPALETTCADARAMLERLFSFGDAGVSAPDAGPAAPDANAGADAGAAQTRPDSGASTTGSAGGGCGCGATTERTGAPAALVALGAITLPAALRRRRARRGSSGAPSGPRA